VTRMVPAVKEAVLSDIIGDAVIVSVALLLSTLGAKLAGFFSRSFIASFIHSEKLGRLITLRKMNEPLLVLAGYSCSVPFIIHSSQSYLPAGTYLARNLSMKSKTVPTLDRPNHGSRRSI